MSGDTLHLLRLAHLVGYLVGGVIGAALGAKFGWRAVPMFVGLALAETWIRGEMP